MDEIFLEDDETGLLVSNLGRVVGPTGKVLKQTKNDSGYYIVGVKGGKRQKSLRVHRLVARNFIPNPLNLPFINHKDECRTNNRVDNLEWCDPKYNATYGNARKKIEKKFVEHGVSKSITLTNGTETKTFSSYHKAAKELGVNISNFNLLRKGVCLSVNGWYIPSDEIGLRLENKTNRMMSTRKRNCLRNAPKSIVLINGDRRVEFESINECARMLGLWAGSVHRVVSGKAKEIHGWRLAQ